ncbi:MAG: transporter substrate-binding domain-containing protein [Anaerolineales bacterium]|nr:transporter substrate-binding domain-containing protein [Anaerolineales bacterium]
MNKRKYAALSMVLVLVLVLLMTACGGQEETEEAAEAQDLIGRILERGVLRVGVGTFVPWSFESTDGELVGYEIDVASKLAEDMGVEIEFVPTDWAGIIPALLTGKFDVIIGGMGITPERATKVNFSIPYEYSGLEVICSKHSMPNVTDIQQLNDPDVTLVLSAAGTPLFWAEKNLPNAAIVNIEEQTAQIQEILNGNADCSMTNPPKYYRDVRDHPDDLYMPFGAQYFGKEYMGFALPKGDADAMFFFNAWITVNQQFLQDQADYWFASADWEHLLPEE